MKRHGIALLAAAALVAGCDDDTTEVATPTTFDVTVENVAATYTYPASGHFAVPESGSEPAPLGPGEAYEVTVPALPGQQLSFATMFVQSNDLFYAPAEGGIALYDGMGTPVSGDVTSQVMLWDAGTETDQPLGEGADQAPRQSGPDTGADDADATVRLASASYNDLPAVSEVIEVTLTPNGDNTFTLRIENVSTSSTLSTSSGSVAVPLSPGVWVTHENTGPLFTGGSAASAGLEDLAEDGSPTVLAETLAGMTGTTTPLAPGAYAVIDGVGTPMFQTGTAASAGLESLAEDGVPGGLVSELMAASSVASSGAFDTPDGASEPGPLLPGSSYSFTVDAVPGDRLQLATMYVQSNDLFYAFAPGGIALYSGDTPVRGDMTAQLTLYDAGTEVNQWPGFGPDQAPRQGGPDTGADEGGTVGAVDDAFSYGTPGDVVLVTITPQDGG